MLPSSQRPSAGTPAKALEGFIKDGFRHQWIGWLGLCGILEAPIEAIEQKNLTVISNNAGIGVGPGRLLATRQTRKMISSHAGENKPFAQQYLSGAL